MFHLLGQLEDFEAHAGEIFHLRSSAESISRQLCGWAGSLQNSDLQRPRHVNDQTRREVESRRRRSAFLDELDRVRSQSEPSPFPRQSAPLDS